MFSSEEFGRGAPRERELAICPDKGIVPDGASPRAGARGERAWASICSALAGWWRGGAQC